MGFNSAFKGLKGWKITEVESSKTEILCIMCIGSPSLVLGNPRIYVIILYLLLESFKPAP